MTAALDLHHRWGSPSSGGTSPGRPSRLFGRRSGWHARGRPRAIARSRSGTAASAQPSPHDARSPRPSSRKMSDSTPAIGELLSGVRFREVRLRRRRRRDKRQLPSMGCPHAGRGRPRDGRRPPGRDSDSGGCFSSTSAGRSPAPARPVGVRCSKAPGEVPPHYRSGGVSIQLTVYWFLTQEADRGTAGVRGRPVVPRREPHRHRHRHDCQLRLRESVHLARPRYVTPPRE